MVDELKPRTDDVGRSYLQHPLPDAMLAVIGDAIVSFAVLEFEMRSLASRLMGVDAGITKIVTSILPFSELRAAVMALWRERGALAVTEAALRELLGRVRLAEEERNRIVHSMWMLIPEDGTIVRVKGRVREKTGYDIRGEVYDAARIHIFAEGLKALAYDVSKFDVGQLMAVELLDK